MIKLENNKQIESFRKGYAVISEGYNLHVWGQESLLVLLKDRFHFRFTKVQTDILSMCNGINTIEDIINKMINAYNIDDSLIENVTKSIESFLINMINKSFLSFLTVSKDISGGKKGRFSGERGKYYPFDITIELTSRCNFRCSFCYKNAEGKGRDIDVEQIEWLKNHLVGKVKEVRLMGGEPTIHPYFSHIVTTFAEDFLVSIVTNGSTLYRYPVDVIQKIDNIQFSLYGYSQESYLINAGAEGWENIKKSVKSANDALIETKGCVTLSKEVIENFENYIKAAIVLGLKRISFGIPSPAGRAQESYSYDTQNHFSEYEKRYIYKLMREMKIKYHQQINIIVWQHNVLNKEQNKVAFEQCDKCLDCGAGWYSLVVSEKGHIRPCELLDEKIFDYGNLSAIEKIVEGYFFEEELKNAIPRFEEYIAKDGVCLVNICPTLDRFKQKERMRYEE